MGLIICDKCGHAVSDNVKTCPKCGMPIQNSRDCIYDKNDHHAAQPESAPQHVVQQSHQPQRTYYDNNATKKKDYKLLIIVLIAAIVVLLGLAGWLWNDNVQKRAELERELAIQAEKAFQDSIAAAELREQARQDSIIQEQINTIYNEYANVLKSVRYSEINGYFLLDLTGDGVPELCFNDFLPEDYTKLPGDDEGGDDGNPFSIISIQDNKAKRIYSLYDEGCYWPVTYYYGKDYLIVEGELCGGAPFIAKIYCNNDGTVRFRTIFEDFYNEKPYPKIKESKVKWNNIRDFESLKNQIKSYIVKHK